MVNQVYHGVDRGRQYFGFVDGLRALAMLGVVGYELVRFLPPAALSPVLLRAALTSANALALFFVISGFVLAYPALNQLHHKRRVDFDPAAYALKRAARIFPTYLVVLALIVLVPLTAGFYGVHALAGTVPPLDRLLQQAVFAGDGLGNDGMWTLAVTARWYVLFPFLLVLWTRSPAVFVGLALLAAGIDALTAAHGWALGAVVPFMLGIIAADMLVHEYPAVRYAFPVALGAGAAAFALDPFLAALPGPAGSPVPFPQNPLWALAFAALTLCAGRAPLLEQALELAPVRLLGKISFAVSLTVVPAAAFASRQLAGSPAAAIGLNAFALTLVCGFVLWQTVDHWFADHTLRASAGRALGSYLDRYGGRSPGNRVRLLADGEPPKPVTRSSLVTMQRRPEMSSALLERAAESPGPIVTMRTGSQADLAAEIHEARRRLAEHAATYFSPEAGSRHAAAVAEHAGAGAIRLDRGTANNAEEADPLAAALGQGVKISVRSRKKPK
jgi:peptidoglycan/LPS O-acetylase OafA/YrhL